jgi:hypothetical protein
MNGVEHLDCYKGGNMKKIIATVIAAIVISTSPIFAEENKRIYNSESKYIGSIRDGKIYDSESRYKGRIEKDKIYNEDSKYIGRTEKQRDRKKSRDNDDEGEDENND